MFRYQFHILSNMLFDVRNTYKFVSSHRNVTIQLPPWDTRYICRLFSIFYSRCFIPCQVSKDNLYKDIWMLFWSYGWIWNQIYGVFMCVLESKGVYLCESKTLRYLKYKCIIYRNNSSVLLVLIVYIHFFSKISYIEKVNTLIKSQLPR